MLSVLFANQNWSFTHSKQFWLTRWNSNFDHRKTLTTPKKLYASFFLSYYELVITNALTFVFQKTGTIWTASAHIVTAVIGSGVLSLAWAIAQLGWLAGPIVMILFSIVTYYTSTLLATCYRSGDQLSGKRNYTYTQAVRSYLGMHATT